MARGRDNTIQASRRQSQRRTDQGARAPSEARLHPPYQHRQARSLTTQLRQMGWTAPNGIMCQIAGCRNLQKEPSTMSITMIGLDTAKSVFQIHGVDAAGKPQLKRKLQREEVVPFFEQQEHCTVVLEACGAGHHWARMLTHLGH